MKIKISRTARGYLAQGRGMLAGAPSIDELIVILHNKGLTPAQRVATYFALSEPPLTGDNP